MVLHFITFHHIYNILKCSYWFYFFVLVALPGGGKNSASAWSSTSLSASHARPPSADQKKRGYQKPWLAGSKTGPKSESLLPTKKTERPSNILLLK